MKKLRIASMAVSLLTYELTTAANATSVFYSASGPWNAAVSGVTTDTYDSYGWSNPYGDELSYAGSVTLSGVTYSFPEVIFGNGPAVTYDAPYLTSPYLEWQYSPNPFTITLPHAVTAVSFDYGEFNGGVYGGPLTFSISLGNGDSTSVVTALNDYAFFGVVSDVPFSSLTINADKDYALMDNFSYATAVPEPGMMVLAGSGGLASLLAFRRRR